MTKRDRKMDSVDYFFWTNLANYMSQAPMNCLRQSSVNLVVIVKHCLNKQAHHHELMRDH